ncbi:Abi-alpha family protein [Mycolicibacter sinensis]|uniref:DUF4393 domain-containing protein n=1 Tax=Mycolicibacter sinensis (strain JDM601) TaxID=875328 RepID=A0A1A3TZT4_MYCSD|nr:Abi-alpha family protein [Mycolicibacter sinensis]OBK88131.1 hypothetical protein A5648_02130 [Mycolicibacter sinensis]
MAGERQSPRDTQQSDSVLGRAARAASEAARIATSPVDAVGVARLAAGSVVRAAGAAAKVAVDTAEQLGAADSLSVTFTAASSRDKRTLRERGDGLLNRPWEATRKPQSRHPAFDRILDELISDEARILRFLAVGGAQPSIDIRTNTPFGVGSQRLAAGISFIADMAGCAWPGRSHEYLGNLDRLGLIRFSAEPVNDFRRYYLLDAHPDAVAAMQNAKRTIGVHRSIYLSVFGEKFCAECFTTTGYDAGGWATYDPGDVYWGKGPR